MGQIVIESHSFLEYWQNQKICTCIIKQHKVSRLLWIGQVPLKMGGWLDRTKTVPLSLLFISFSLLWKPRFIGKGSTATTLDKIIWNKINFFIKYLYMSNTRNWPEVETFCKVFLVLNPWSRYPILNPWSRYPMWTLLNLRIKI